LVIIDTDIGDDIDDAFAIGLALQSPELKILGITTAWGNTPLRARLTERFLKETGHADVPVAVGIEKYPAKGTLHFTQAQYAQRGPQRTWPGAVDFLLAAIREHPGEITLIAIGPETNLGAAIERDAATFRKLKRVVLMGGSVYRRYDGFAYPTVVPHPQPVRNIRCDARFDADPIAGTGTCADLQQREYADGCLDGAVPPAVLRDQAGNADVV